MNILKNNALDSNHLLLVKCNINGANKENNTRYIFGFI